MTERWSPLDRALYGAEDDEEMDMILRHIGRAMADPKSDHVARTDADSKRRGEGKKPPQ